MTERERILERREVFSTGAVWANGMQRHDAPNLFSGPELRDEAARRFPLPKVTRQRVLRDPHDESVTWEARFGGVNVVERGACSYSAWPTAQRIKMWADLLANPTEDVPDDGASSPSLPGASS